MYFGITQELLADLRRKAIKVKIARDIRTSSVIGFSEPEIDLFNTLSPAMIFAIVDRIDTLEAELADRPVVYIELLDGNRRESSAGIPVLYTRKEIETCLSSLDFRPYKGDSTDDTA